jgi:hypothetical protein
MTSKARASMHSYVMDGLMRATIHITHLPGIMNLAIHITHCMVLEKVMNMKELLAKATRYKSNSSNGPYSEPLLC